MNTIAVNHNANVKDTLQIVNNEYVKAFENTFSIDNDTIQANDLDKFVHNFEMVILSSVQHFANGPMYI